MISVALIVAAAAVALGLAKLARVPGSVLAVVAGVGLRLLSAPSDSDVTRDALLVAATFLVFTVGAEIDRRPLRTRRTAALALAALSLLVTAAAGGLLYAATRLDPWAVTYMVLALGGGSTLFVFEMLRRRERFFEPVGRALTAATLAQDLIAVVALAGLAAFAGLERGAPDALWPAAGLVGLTLGAWATSRWLAPALVLRAGFDEEERLLLVLLVLFSFTAVARWSGNPLVVGAYLGGMAISRFPVGGMARGYLKSFADFFTMVFYVTLGMLLVPPDVSQLLAEAVFVAALLLARPIVLLPLVRRMGFAVRSSVEAAVLLTPVGELAAIVTLAGMELGHVGEHTLSVVTAVIVITTALAPWLSSDRVIWWLTHAYPFGGRVTLEPPPSGHVLLLGCGQTGAALLDALQAADARVVVVDDDPDVVRELEERGVAALRGDAAGPAILRAAGAEAARAVVSTMRRPAENDQLLGALEGVPVFVRVFSEPQAERVRRLGGHPVTEAEVAAEALLEWVPPPRTRRTWP